MSKWYLLVVLFAVICNAAVQAEEEHRFVRSRTISVPRTGSTVSVQYTAQGVPFVSAATEYDLFYGQGLVVAENRLWQMEFFKRFMLGTLSEIFGEATVNLDISQRRNDWREVATENMNNTPQEYLDVISAYIDGVNQFLADCKTNSTLLPPEFAQYGAPFPANYEVVDTFVIVKALATGLAGNAGDEFGNAALISKVGVERFLYLQSRNPSLPHIMPPYQHSNYNTTSKRSDIMIPHHGTVGNDHCSDERQAFKDDDWVVMEAMEEMPFPKELEDWGFVLPQQGAAQRALKHSAVRDHDSSLAHYLELFPPTDVSEASNNWAISGDLTFSGKPMMCNDPHLAYMTPNVWFLMGLDMTNEDGAFQEIVGATVILAPGIGIGKNKYLSWGYTTCKSDSQDYFEMVNADDGNGYVWNGTILQYEKKNTTIEVKNAPSVTVELLFSRYGPVTIDDGSYYSLAWSALGDVDNSPQALVDSNRATTMQEWRDSMSKWNSLLFNAAYTDNEGNFGIQVVGLIPIRAEGAFGYAPQPGDGSWDWRGYIPFEDMPASFNHPQGFVVSANNMPGKPDLFQYLMPGDYAVGFRAQRIVDLLLDAVNDEELLTVGYMEQIQSDVTSLNFFQLYPALDRLVLDNEYMDYLAFVLSWNGNEPVRSTEAAIFEAWVDCLYNVTFYETGTTTKNPWLMAQWFNNAQPNGSGDDISCTLWGETCLTYASTCFQSAVDKYAARGPVVEGVEYGKTHLAVFAHLPPAPVTWNRVAQVGGDKWTPNCCTFTITIPGVKQTPVFGGPSVRIVVDQSHETPAQFIMPMGESGDPRSPHYDDMLELWANMQYLSLDWDE